MKYFYTILIFFLSTNFWMLGSSKSKPPRPPFPAEHIPNFSNNNSSALSVFSSSSNRSSEEKKSDLSQKEQKSSQKKTVVISCAPLPICYENKAINQPKSCLKKQIPEISDEQKKLRQTTFHKKNKLNDISILMHKKSSPCSDCSSGYNHLQCAFLCQHYLSKLKIKKSQQCFC